MSDQTQPTRTDDGLRERYAAALRDAITSAPTDDANDLVPAVLAVRDRRMEQLEAKVADYEHRIGWHTTCQSCARILDSAYSETARAEQAEAAIARVRSLTGRWAKRTDQLKRAAELLEAALDEPGAPGA